MTFGVPFIIPLYIAHEQIMTADEFAASCKAYPGQMEAVRKSSHHYLDSAGNLMHREFKLTQWPWGGSVEAYA